MQPAQPVHRPEVTTSVKSSAQWGFSGGMAQPYRRRHPGARAGRRRVGYPRRRARAARGRALPAAGRAVPSTAPSPRCTARMPGSSRVAATGAALRRALVGHRFVGGPADREAPPPRHRRRPDARAPLRDDRHPGGGRRGRGRPSCSTPQPRRDPAGTGGRLSFEDGGRLVVQRSATAGRRAARSRTCPASGPTPWPSPRPSWPPPCGARGTASRPGCSTSPGWPASAT